jgi:hypothetical protein
VVPGYWGEYLSFLGAFDPKVKSRQIEGPSLFTDTRQSRATKGVGTLVAFG